MKKERISYYIITFFILLCPLLFICACDLFNGPVQRDFLAQIDEEIAWSNAERLTVRVDYNPQWGSSPQQGALNSDHTRQGYAFDVEFNPLPGYGFEEWLAFTTDAYNGLDLAQTASQVKEYSLNGNGVDITAGVNAVGAQTATVTINITEPVTVVPWCGNRPRLDRRTNPPLDPIMTPFPYDQRVNIWFNMNIKHPTVALGESIAITGVNLADNPLHGSRGEPFNGDGDLTQYFDLEFPDTHRVTLAPKADTAGSLALLSISVRVGPGIENENGIPMAGAETVSYQTDSSQAQKAYRAADIAASPDGISRWFADSATYPWNSPSIDRRFNLAANTVSLRFSVNPPEGAPSTPDMITIIERRAYDLRGFNASGQSSTDYRNIIPAGGTYSLTHQLKTTDSGIIQLIVLPSYNNADSPVLPLDVNTAISEGQYVTVVIDNAPPNLSNPGARLNTPSSIESGTGIYVYGREKEPEGITLTLAGLENLVDNGTQGGIPASQAWGVPWTMDDAGNLFWHVRIGEESHAERQTNAEKLRVHNGSTFTDTWNLAAITGLTNADGYRVYVKFEDGIGNISLDWIDTGLRVKYSNAQINTVSGLRAVCNDAGNTISVTWAEPGEYLYPEIVIRSYRAGASGDVFESETRHDFGKAKAGSHAIPVSTLTTSGVRDGNPASGVYGYEIKVITYNTAGTAETPSIWVYNISGMDTQLGTVRIESGNQLTVAAGDLAKNIVLTRDMVLSGHNPIANFTGKFYGNGHTVTVGGFASGANVGLFGIANNALIRDLSVVYTGTASINGSTATTSVGGIAGQAIGSTEILNCIARGETASSVLSVSAGAETRLGGIAGYMSGTARIENCRAALNVTLAGSVSNAYHVGGVVGNRTGSDSTSVSLKSINSVATVSMNKTNATGVNNCGGVAGYLEYTNMADCVFGGKIDIPGTYSANTNGESYIGGLVGEYAKKGEADNCHVTGSIIVNSSGTSVINMGGVVGRISGTSSSRTVIRNSNYSNGEIRFESSGNATYQRIGGYVGEMWNYGGIENCVSQAISVTGLSTANISNLFIGGFGGELNQATISNCSSTSMVIVPASHTSTGGVRAGGFAGTTLSVDGVPTTMTNCFATGSVNVHSQGNSGAQGSMNHIGGFVGLAANNEYTNSAVNTFNKCYAKGDVSAVQYGSGTVIGNFNVGGLVGTACATEISECYATGRVEARKGSGGTTAPIIAGGLVGFLGWTSNIGGVAQMSAIWDSYATGDVIADNPFANAAVYAGGLVGYIQIVDSTQKAVRHSFAAGSVSAKNLSSTTGVWAGGIAGYKQSGLLNNCVAAGKNVHVSAQGGNDSRFAYRIYGASAGTAPATNHGRDDILVGTSESYNANSVFLATASTLNTAGAQNGANATNANLIISTSPSTWNAVGIATSAFWNMGPIARGYPALRNVGGDNSK
jgi:hypothetical protein